MVTKVRGSFNDFEGSGYFDSASPEKSHFEVTIKAKSIDTRNADRDAHLRGNDFFDMDNYPEIRFVSTGVEVVDPTTYRVTGDLTIKGVTRPVSIDFEYTGAAVDPFQNHRVGFEGTVTVNRKDWGINWNAALEAGGVSGEREGRSRVRGGGGQEPVSILSLGGRGVASHWGRRRPARRRCPGVTRGQR